MYCEEHDGGELPTLQSTTWYYYNASGNIKQIITEENGSDIYTSTRLVYARNGQAVSYIIGETCDETDSKDPVYAFSYAREFRYDSARQRYLSAELSYSSGWSTVSETWSDYDGDSIYGDFSVVAGVGPNDPPVVTNLTDCFAEPTRKNTCDARLAHRMSPACREECVASLSGQLSSEFLSSFCQVAVRTSSIGCRL